ncbi:MAG: hypothetical protein AAGU74_08440 [Bacillota bacterium]
MTRPRIHTYFCQTCGREYAFPAKLKLPTGCVDCGDYIKPLQLPKIVIERRIREMPSPPASEERHPMIIQGKHIKKRAGSQ